MSKIGRKIYFEKATGNVLVDTGERSGAVIETTIEQDFQSYVALSERVPETIGCIQFDFGQHSDEFAQYSLRINPTTEELIWTPHNNGTLEDTREQKIDQLNGFCNTSILAGFTSDALGNNNSYDFSPDDQINLGGMLNAITAGLVQAPIIWKASGIPQPHTIEQFKQVFADGLNHKNTQIGKYWELKAQVEEATTIEEINAIIW